MYVLIRRTVKCGVQCLALPIILVSNRTMIVIVLPCPLNLHNTYISTYIHMILIYECTYVHTYAVCIYIYIYIYILCYGGLFKEQ